MRLIRPRPQKSLLSTTRAKVPYCQIVNHDPRIPWPQGPLSGRSPFGLLNSGMVALPLALIQPSAWKGNSQKFAKSTHLGYALRPSWLIQSVHC